MKASPHTHAESPLTGSIIGALVAKAKELGRTHIAYTDHGHLSSALKVYAAAKKKGLKFIPGIEIYFKDSKCPIVSATPANRCKYFTASIYCQDQEAYQELCKIVSRTDFPTIEVREERQQLWAWEDLQRISKFNVNMVLGGVHCMVGKPMLAGEAAIGQAVLLKLVETFGKERIFTSILCEPWLKKWTNVVKIDYADGSSDSLLANDQVSTDRARRIKAMDLIERRGHNYIKSKSVGVMHSTVDKAIWTVKLHKGFLPLPGGDASLKVNMFLYALAKRHGLTTLVSDYAYYANKEDKVVQTMRLEGNDKLQPNLHMKTTQEIGDYLVGVMGFNPADVDNICDNNDRWAALFDNLKLDYKWRLAEVDGDPLKLAMAIIKEEGRMKWDNPMWVDRLKYELNVIAKNPVFDLTPYFLPIRDVLNHYKDNGQLPGPGRGSAGGSLFCYLLGITEIDPFEYDLPFNRFFSMERINLRKLPDIDVDLEDRTLLVGEDGKSGYLYGRWGNKAAQVSTRTTIRLKSAVKDTNRYFKGKVEDEIEKFTQGLPAPPQGVSDLNWVFGYEDDEGNHVPGLIEQSESLRHYRDTRPDEWNIVSKAMGLTRAFSRHASAFVVADVPIQDVVATKDTNITQYEAKECEAAGLIKYDFLVINQLKDIRVCLDMINKLHDNGPRLIKGTDEVGWYHSESGSGECSDCGDPRAFLNSGHDGLCEIILREEAESANLVEALLCSKCNKPFSKAKYPFRVGNFTHKGEKTHIWRLPKDPDVFKSVWGGSTETIFQINTRSMIPVVTEILPADIMALSNILALVRPGPMDMIDPKTGRTMVEEYIQRLKGQSQPDIPELAAILPESYGIMIYQEQLGKVAKQLAGFTNEAAEQLRENMAKKRMVELVKTKPAFVAGAILKVSQEVAENIWEQMVTFGRYGFSVIHAVEYAHITYACMFLKHHYPLEWWAAILTNADEKEITGTFWPFVKDIVLPPDINLSGDTMVVDYANGKIRSKLGVIRGIGDKTIEPIVNGRPYRDIQDFVDKGVAGPSLSHKLIHVGVLDSLFPPKISLREKLQLFENAVEMRDFQKKVAKAQAEGKKMKATEPKVGVVSEDYMNLHPIKDAAMRKSVLPSLPIDLFDLGRRYSKVKSKKGGQLVTSTRGYDTLLIDGERLRRLDDMPGDEILKDIYIASTCYVIESKEFAYGKTEKKKALKLVLDSDGYISEKVIWPGYESGQLEYPKSLKKGAIATFFLRKRIGKKDMAVMSVTVETEEAPAT